MTIFYLNTAQLENFTCHIEEHHTLEYNACFTLLAILFSYFICHFILFDILFYAILCSYFCHFIFVILCSFILRNVITFILILFYAILFILLYEQQSCCFGFFPSV